MAESQENNPGNRHFPVSKSFYQALWDNAPNMIILCDANLKILFVNPTAESTLGCKPDELIGKHLQDFTHPDDKLRLMQDLGDLKSKSGTESINDYKFMHRDGKEHTFEAIHQNLLDNPDLKAIVGIFRDVTERRQIEEAFRKSDELFKNMANNVPDVLWETDEHGNTYYITPNVEKVFGFTPDEVYSSGEQIWFGRMHEDDVEKVEKAFKSIFQGSEYNIEYRIRRKDGQWIWLHDRGIGTVMKHGSRRVYGVFNDVTERKENEEALRMTQYSVDKNLTPIIWVAPDSRIIYVNDAICRTLGYTREELMSMTIPDVDVIWQREKWESPDGYSLLKNEGTFNFESILKRKDGTEFPVEIRTSVVEFHEKEFLMAFLIDVTQRRETELKLHESEEKLSRYFYVNPLATALAEMETMNILDVNEAYAELFGYSRDEVINQSGKLGFTVLDKKMVSRLSAELIRGKVVRGVEFDIKTKTGEIKTVSAALAPVKLGSRTFAYIITVDLTERIRAERDLKSAFTEIENLKKQLEAENISLRAEIKLAHEHPEITGESTAMKNVLSQVEKVAPTDSTVLILGETGTGKELIARAIHRLSRRNERTMVIVNCASLPPTLIEGELFGREKGAYTGALTEQAGRFELADGSSIFLDEIGELTTDLQVKLLRVIQESEFERLGSSKTIKVNVRIIAATNQNLSKLVREGKFREDLFYRLNVFPIEIPPLRERKEDIPLLVWQFVNEFNKKIGKRIESISKNNMVKLQNSYWSGNVRELRNVIERAMIQSSGKELMIDLPSSDLALGDEKITLDEIQRKHIINVLNNTGWKVRGKNGAAEILGMNPSTLDSKMKKLGILKPE
jgi:PAS domain S-box-containing protein